MRNLLRPFVKFTVKAAQISQAEACPAGRYEDITTTCRHDNEAKMIETSKLHIGRLKAPTSSQKNSKRVTR